MIEGKDSRVSLQMLSKYWIASAVNSSQFTLNCASTTLAFLHTDGTSHGVGCVLDTCQWRSITHHRVQSYLTASRTQAGGVATASLAEMAKRAKMTVDLANILE